MKKLGIFHSSFAVQLPEWIDCFSRKKIDGFVTQYAQTVGSVCSTLSMENDSGSICFIRKTLLRNSSFDKSDSLSIPNLFFTSDDVTYLRERFQKQKPLPQCDTLREKRGNDTLLSAYGSIFFLPFFLFDCPRTSLTAVAEFEGIAQQETLR